MSEQLARWKGDFGDAYLERNRIDPETRVDWFRKTLAPLNEPMPIIDVLEVGCNRAHNLAAINSAIHPYLIVGIEPNAQARAEAVPIFCQHVSILDGTVYQLPEAKFDLVLSSGLLIHIPPDRLDEALREMHRVARRFLLAVEYAGAGEAVEYRGHLDMLWRRDYGAEYLRLFPKLVQREWGDLTDADGFGRARYWLLEKPA